jgi:hypothetical protein
LLTLCDRRGGITLTKSVVCKVIQFTGLSADYVVYYRKAEYV